MNSVRALPAWTAAALLCVVTGVLLFGGLASFGIWDPWELDRADAARELLEGGALGGGPSLGPSLVASGFRWFGVHEWAGRLPIALTGFGTVALAFVWVGWFAGVRVGAYAAAVTTASPLFLLNARQMLGDAPAYFAQTLVVATATAAVFAPWQTRSPASEGTTAAPRPRSGWTLVGLSLVGALVAIYFAAEAAGALQGVLPALWAVVAAGVIERSARSAERSLPQLVALTALGLTAVLITGWVGWSVAMDHADYSAWLGGKPRGGDPPTFEVAFETLFHSFAPWSALLPLALGRLLWRGDPGANIAPNADPAAPGPAATRQTALRMILLIWASLGYAAMTLFGSRYGVGSFLPVVAVATAVALLLRDAEDARHGWWASAAVSLLFLGLLIRDFALYPMSPVAGLGLEGLTGPEGFKATRPWAAALGAFGVLLFLAFCAPDGRTLRLKAPYRLIRDQWKRGLGFRLWLLAGAAALAGAVVFGVIAFFVEPGQLGLTVLAVKTGRRLAVVIPAAAAAIALGQLALFAVAKLGRFRMVTVIAAGVAVGGYVTFGYVPELSSHFSPRQVYDTYNELAQADEPLGEYRVGQRAAAYYATGEIQEFAAEAALIDFLATDERRWAVFPTDDLASINRAFRGRTTRHLFVADARSARVLLATNQPLSGRQDENYLADTVLDRAPTMAHRVGAVFQNKVELLGYDLELPHDGYVGAGESFTVTWYWKALAPVPGGYKVFLHIDGQGHRVHGDHDPVDGKYPLRLWQEGDVVVDRQELGVAANYRPGPYTFFIGLYAGENRLPVTQGRQDGENRVIAGILEVR